MNNEPYGLVTAAGLELTSNDRRLKYIVRKSVAYLGSMEQYNYVAHCYVKDESGWQPTAHGQTFPDLRSFLATLSETSEFTRGIAEIENENIS